MYGCRDFLEPLLTFILRSNTWEQILRKRSTTLSSRSIEARKRSLENVKDILFLQDLRLICKTSNSIVTKWFNIHWRHNCWAQMFNKFIPYYTGFIPKLIFPNEFHDSRNIATDYFQQLLNYREVYNHWGENMGDKFCIEYFRTVEYSRIIRRISYRLELIDDDHILDTEYDEEGEDQPIFRMNTVINMTDGSLIGSLQDEILYPYAAYDSKTANDPIYIHEAQISEIQPYINFLILPQFATEENLEGLPTFAYR